MFLLLAFVRLPNSSDSQDAEGRHSHVLRGDGNDTNIPEIEPLLDHE